MMACVSRGSEAGTSWKTGMLGSQEHTAEHLVVLLCCRCCQAPVGIFFPFLFWGRCPLVQSRLAALVDTQLRLTHVLPPMRVQTRSIPLALFPPLT
jgi:hypothetical protein